MSGLRLRAVRKSYGAGDVVKGVDLDIAPREFVVIVGPSGCGKTTLLRMIAGLERVSSGTIEIGGRDVTELDPSQRGIAMVFQSYALYPHLTVRENMGFALRFAGVAKSEIARQVADAAATLELTPFLDRLPGQLSGGQRQRVAIGRAIVRHPEVFLFDEPLSNLDAELRVNTRIEIARLHKTLATTIIYVTHDQVEAMTLADKIVVLRDGVVAQVGTPLDLYDDPDNLFVAGFIGSPKMNFLRGVASPANQASAGFVTLPDHANQSVPLPAGLSLAGHSEVTIGLRPEHFSQNGTATLVAEIELIERLGGETFAHARCGEKATLTIKTGNDRSLGAGHAFTARFDPDCLLVFDGAGQRIR